MCAEASKHLMTNVLTKQRLVKAKLCFSWEKFLRAAKWNRENSFQRLKLGLKKILRNLHWSRTLIISLFNANTSFFFACLVSHPSVSILLSHQKSNTENVITVISPNWFARGSCKQNQRDQSVLWASVTSAATLKSDHGLLHGLILPRAALEEKSLQTLLSTSVLLVLLEIPLSSLFRTIRKFLQESYQLILALPLWQQNRVNCQHLTKHLASLATRLLFFLQVYGDCTCLWSPGQNKLKML